MREIHPQDLILVAIINRPRDLEIARVLGWYRIPLGSAPRTIRVDWLAFYQTAAFGEERWAVRYVAPVRGFELRTRGELLQDEPDHARAGEPYYKIQLGALRELSRPIPAGKWRRFTFLYTTGRRLLSANELKELRVPPSTEHDMLWKMIRERGDGEGARGGGIPWGE
jgi:hypothetical protein